MTWILAVFSKLQRNLLPACSVMSVTEKVGQLLGHDGIISFCFFSSDMFFFLCHTMHKHCRFKITLPNTDQAHKKYL